MRDSQSAVEAEGRPGLKQRTMCRKPHSAQQEAPPGLERMGP
jgi:hypothetical protein